MNNEMIGLIPAAGKGLRLGLPYPKELYPIIRNNRYKPIAQFVLDDLVKSGVHHIVLVINDTKHQLIGYFGDGHRFGCNISYVVQEPRSSLSSSTSPGLAHALNAAYHLTQNKQVFFGMADTIMQPAQVFELLAQSLREGDDVAMGLFPTDRPDKFGMVLFDTELRVQRIIDKPAETDLKMMWGCIAWKPTFTEYLHQAVEQEGIADFALVMNRAIEAGLHFRAVCIPNGSYIDLGTYDEIAEMDRSFRDEATL